MHNSQSGVPIREKYLCTPAYFTVHGNLILALYIVTL